MSPIEWDDDFDDLVDALALVEEFDFADLETSSLSSLSTAKTCSSEETDENVKESTTSNLTTSKSKRAKKRRNRPRDELQSLRATVRLLETRLAILRDQTAKGSNPSQKANAVVSKMWRGIADRQLRERDQSERENARLHAMVEEQLRMIKTLEQIVLKKRKKASLYIPPPLQSEAVYDPVNDPFLEKLIEGEVEDMLNEIDHITNDPRFGADLENPVHTSDVIIGENEDLVVETLDEWFFPFEWQTTADALWTMWKSMSMDLVNEPDHNNLRSNDSTVWRIDAGKFENLGTNLQFRSKLIGRRRIEAHRVVMTSVFLVHPLQVDGNAIQDVFIRFRLWNVFRPVEVSGMSSGMTCRQVYTQCSLERPQGSIGDASHGVDLLASAVLHICGPRVELNNQILENELLQRFNQLQVQTPE